MRRCVLTLLALLAAVSPCRSDDAAAIRLVTFEGPLTGPSAHRIVASIDDADRAGDGMVLIELDTPGGLVTAMERVVKRMLSAKTPIVVWVGPAGARAASAGFFVLLAADIAAMAPGTRAGAASVVTAFGENAKDDVMLQKANEDAAALIRTICEHRQRNVEAAEKAVFGAKSYTDAAAQQARLIDVVARSRQDLLAALDGRVVRRFDGSSVTVRTKGATVRETQFDWKQRMFEFLGQPEIAGLLLLLGLGGLYIELTHPGLFVPAIVGVLSLVLFAISASILPISTLGVLLILLAIALFVLEVKFVSHGLLTAGGLAALIAGALLLVDGPIPELRLSLGFVLPSALAVATVCAVAVRFAAQAQAAPVQTGVEGLRGERGTVVRTVDPVGAVFVHGEIWEADSSSGPLATGTEVRVVQVREMRLTVEPVPAAGTTGGR